MCGDSGQWTPDVCPAQYVTAEIWDALSLSDMARKGCWPLTGGLLDQTRWFIEFCRYAWNEQDAMKAKLNIRD